MAHFGSDETSRDSYLAELQAEKDNLDAAFPHCQRLVSQEIDRVKTGGSQNPSATVSLVEKIGVPVKDFPGFNFVGRLLGPRGLTMKRMQTETNCKMTIMGRGSVRDAAKEEELRMSGDPKYEHLKDNLYVLIEAKGSQAIAAARLAAGIAEVRKMLIPCEFDQIREDQLRELAVLNGMRAHSASAAVAEQQHHQHQQPVVHKYRPVRQSVSGPPSSTNGSSIEMGGRYMATSASPSDMEVYPEVRQYAPPSRGGYVQVHSRDGHDIVCGGGGGGGPSPRGRGRGATVPVTAGHGHVTYVADDAYTRHRVSSSSSAAPQHHATFDTAPLSEEGHDGGSGEYELEYVPAGAPTSSPRANPHIQYTSHPRSVPGHASGPPASSPQETVWRNGTPAGYAPSGRYRPY